MRSLYGKRLPLTSSNNFVHYGFSKPEVARYPLIETPLSIFEQRIIPETIGHY